jgi:uncharacterized protein YkwD
MKNMKSLGTGMLLALVCAVPPSTATAGGSPILQALDHRVDQALHEVTTAGVGLYNNGDHAGCARIFEGGLVAVRPLLDHRPSVQQTIADGLASARRSSRMDDRAFQLREVIDQTRAILKPRTFVQAPPVVQARVNQPAIIRQGDFTLAAMEQSLLELTNQERAKEGLQPLRASAKLFQAARSHSTNMASQGQMAHELDGKNPGDRLREVGYVGSNWGENVAAGQRTPAEVVEGWMNSEGHRRNILNPQYTEIGLGIAGGDRGGYYWTQVFGTPAR